MDKARSKEPVGLKERVEYNENYQSGYRDPDERRDGYQLKWVGKEYAHWQKGAATEAMLYPDSKHNRQEENKNSENVFLTGDNLDALKYLQNCYKNAIKMIYIDPPYNTGSDGFAYNDKRILDDELLYNVLGYDAKDIARLRSLEGRASHSAWLTFMYPRLRLAQELLTDDGIIFISIDDNEQANLKLLCDEIFGENNFVSCVTRVAKRTSNKGTYFRPTKDYILAYAHDVTNLNEFINSKKIDIKEYKLEDKDGRKYKKSGASLYQPSLESRKNQRFYIKAPDGTLIIPPGKNFPEEKDDGSKITPQSNSDKVWRWTVDTYFRDKNRLIFTKGSAKNPLLDEFGNQSKWNIYPKVYFDEEENKKLRPEDIIYNYTNSQSTKELIKLDISFKFAKPSSLIMYLMMVSQSKEYDIILDFFAGSATTAHAVMALNKEDGGNRRYIMCQLDEEISEGQPARQEGYQTIDQIARERIKRAAKQLDDHSGFQHFYVKQPTEKTIDQITEFDPLKSGFLEHDMVSAFAKQETATSGEDTILATWLALDGYKLTQKPETIDLAGYQAHYIDGRLYAITEGWGSEQTRELLNRVGKFEIGINTLVIYPYSFTYQALRELETNLKSVLDGDNRVELERRY